MHSFCETMVLKTRADFMYVVLPQLTLWWSRFNNTGGCGNVGCNNHGTGNVGSNNSGSNNHGDNNNGSNNVGFSLNGSNLSGDQS